MTGWSTRCHTRKPTQATSTGEFDTAMISQDVATREIYYIRRAGWDGQEHAASEAGGGGAGGRA
jgi:hypothetical protein